MVGGGGGREENLTVEGGGREVRRVWGGRYIHKWGGGERGRDVLMGIVRLIMYLQVLLWVLVND